MFGDVGKFFEGAANTTLSFIPGVGDYMATKDANEKNMASAREQMAFQERMSNTGYQRATDDMKKAGLNPMLAYTQGPASTPSGAMASQDPESRTGTANFLAQAYGLNTQAKSAKAQIRSNEATAETTAKQGQLVEQNTETAKHETDMASAKAKAFKEEMENKRREKIAERKWIEDRVDTKAVLEGAGITNTAKNLKYLVDTVKNGVSEWWNKPTHTAAPRKPNKPNQSGYYKER